MEGLGTNTFYLEGKKVNLLDPQNHVPSNYLYTITVILSRLGRDAEIPFNQSLMLIHLN